MRKLSFGRILITLLRPLSAQALFQNGRFNKDGQKNKQEYMNKNQREMLVRIIFFINIAYIWIE